MTSNISNNETFFIALVLLALLLPLLSFLLSMITSERYSWLISMNAPLLMLISSVCSAIVAFSLWNNNPYILKIDWFSFGSHNITADIILSNESVVMLAVVSFISFLVHMYSIGYMAGDLNVKKYFAMLGFFTFSMQGIVLSDNLLLLFIFWELVGFSSYILIGHWNEKPSAARAASKAFIMNRVGDAGFLIGLMIVWMNAGTFNLSDMVIHGSNWQTAASLCIFCGVIGKSAQFPLLTWLPDAMEGPTPVSALIHAATMVAAGIYLLIRTAPLFTEFSLMIVAATGAVTALLGALSALFQHDIKRILAYSTISHLGVMIMAIGMGAYQAAFLHLFTHAFFKACLFLCAGAIHFSLKLAQHQANVDFNEMDIRNLGGLRKKLPVIYYCTLISGASLAGVPFFSGFLSKDAIVAAAWNPQSPFGWFLLISLFIILFLSALYIFRLIASVFWGEERKTATLNVFISPFVMRGPMILLAFLSLWFVVNWNPFDFNGWMIYQAVESPWTITLTSIAILALSIFTGYSLFLKQKFSSSALLENAFYLDTIYNKTIVAAAQVSSRASLYLDKKVIDGVIHGAAYVQITTAHLVAWFDRAIVDGIVNAFAWIGRTIGSLTRSFQGGNIQVYIFWSLFAIIIFLIWTMN